MSVVAGTRPASSVASGVAAVRGRRIVGPAVLAVLLAGAAAGSPAVGARALSPAEVWDGLFASPGPGRRLTEIRLIVQTVRLPRTVLAIVAGVALGVVGGALIQGSMRNPIADTGLLGVNSGASFAVVTAVAPDRRRLVLVQEKVGRVGA